MEMESRGERGKKRTEKHPVKKHNNIGRVHYKSSRQGTFLFQEARHDYIYCGSSLKVPHRSTSNEYTQHMFLSRNKKSIYLILLSRASV